MEVDELVRVDLDRFRVLQLLKFAESTKVDVVGRVERLGNSEYAVCHRDAPTENGRVFYIVDSVHMERTAKRLVL